MATVAVRSLRHRRIAPRCRVGATAPTRRGNLAGRDSCRGDVRPRCHARRRSRVDQLARRRPAANTVSRPAAIVRGTDWRAVNAITIAGLTVGSCAVALVHSAVSSTLFSLSFALLAVAGAYAFDEPAGVIVDVAPIGRVMRTAAHGVVCLAPLSVGLALAVAAAIRGPDWSAASLALAAL